MFSDNILTYTLTCAGPETKTISIPAKQKSKESAFARLQKQRMKNMEQQLSEHRYTTVAPGLPIVENVRLSSEVWLLKAVCHC